MIALLRRSGASFWLLGAMSLLAALLQFVVPLYMMAIYNRILQTGSMDTLQMVSGIAAVLLLVLGVTDAGRTRILTIMAKALSADLDGAVYRAVMTGQHGFANAISDEPAVQVSRARPLDDLRQLSHFVASGAINTFFDALLAPLFILALFILHPLLGWIGLVAAVVILALSITAERLARTANQDISVAEGRARARVERSLAQGDAVAAMGMVPRLYGLWQQDRDIALAQGQSSQTIVGAISSIARALRLVVQIGMLGAGAWLVLTTDYFLAGAIIAGSIILGRALAPIDQSITLWPRFVQARAAAQRLADLIATSDQQTLRGKAPPMRAELTIDRLTLLHPGQPTALLQDASITIGSGQILGILGPNGAGKTTLLRTLAGLHKPRSGSVRLGDTPVLALSDADRDCHIGYLPQDIQLLPGTVAENIARFAPDATMGAIHDAAAMAGATAPIEAMKDGFSTYYRPDQISAGQKQRIGLARALYGAPALLLMDEPSANLDGQGQAQLIELLKARRDSGGVTVIVSHDSALLGLADNLLQIAHGKARFGAADEMLRFLARDNRIGLAS